MSNAGFHFQPISDLLPLQQAAKPRTSLISFTSKHKRVITRAHARIGVFQNAWKRRKSRKYVALRRKLFPTALEASEVASMASTFTTSTRCNRFNINQKGNIHA